MTLHKEEKRFPCNLCEHSFSNKRNQITHKEMEHKGKERKFTCSQCLKSYKQPHGLKSHQLQHGGVALHSCDLCPKTFLEGHLLKQHINRIHTKSELFSCDQCTKTFNASSSLWYHKKRHSDERPYICDQCPKSFKLPGYLKSHKLTHNSEKSFKCDDCDKLLKHPRQLRAHKKYMKAQRFAIRVRNPLLMRLAYRFINVVNMVKRKHFLVTNAQKNSALLGI